MTSTPRVTTVAPPQEPGAPVAFARCSLLRLPSFAEDRGILSVAELGVALPFEVKRSFTIHRVPEGSRRGGHAMARSQELMIGVAGSVTVDVDDGSLTWRVVLDDPTIALYVPTGVWCEEHSFSADAVLLVLASEVYDVDEFDVDRPGAAGRD